MEGCGWFALTAEETQDVATCLPKGICKPGRGDAVVLRCFLVACDGIQAAIVGTAKDG